MKIDLTGRIAFITGGSKGLGLATAVEMAASGAHVAIMARDANTLSHARAQILAQGPSVKVCAVQGDVTSAEQLFHAHAQVVRELGPVDILVNNAGKRSSAPFAEITDAMWALDIDLKLMACVRLTRLVWPSMVARRWGRVINVLNTYAKTPLGGTAPTSVTRAAQLALTKVMAQEGGPHNVLVNALLVGLVKSDQVVRLYRDSGSTLSLDEFMLQQAVQAKVPAGRIGEASEFANMACFLASDAASYINGNAINVDGGMSPVA